ncbi:MAG: GGDEF domain-containing phosphodiesterase, partial [Pseudomonadota bacterium]
PIVVENSELHVSTSIGIASFPNNGYTMEALLRCADVALYEAKAAGRRTFKWFHAEMDEVLHRRQLLETGLRQAFEEDRLELHFQPQVDLSTRHIVGVEALIRWTDPTLGRVSPSVLIEVANQCGLILELGAWIIETACQRAASWAEQGINIQLAVNLSPAQLHHQNFLAMLDEAISRTGFCSRHLTLEITEDLLLQDDDATVEKLNGLRQRGITLAVDDFGTGYSNLGYLKRLPIQYLKIDQTFIRDIETDANDRAIIHGIIGLAKSLGLETIAEGVESENQRHFLLDANCHLAQGFLFAPALPESELFELFADDRELTPLSPRPQHTPLHSALGAQVTTT